MHNSRGISRSEVLLIAGLTIAGVAILWFITIRSRQGYANRQCATNVKELGMALIQYSYDNGDFPPPYTNIEARLAKEAGTSKLPTKSEEPQLLRNALRLYTDDDNWFCPDDQLAKQDKYYLGIRHQLTSYAFPTYVDKKGKPLSVYSVPVSLKYWLVQDASGDRKMCEDDLWLGGSKNWATNHPDGYVNVAIADLSIHHLPGEEAGKLVP